jgi:hypothetical protein
MGRERKGEGTVIEEKQAKRDGNRKTYLVDSVEILAQVAQVDIGLDNILQSHVSSLENSFQILNNLSSPILNLGCQPHFCTLSQAR